MMKPRAQREGGRAIPFIWAPRAPSAAHCGLRCRAVLWGFPIPPNSFAVSLIIHRVCTMLFFLSTHSAFVRVYFIYPHQNPFVKKKNAQVACLFHRQGKVQKCHLVCPQAARQRLLLADGAPYTGRVPVAAGELETAFLGVLAIPGIACFSRL